MKIRLLLLLAVSAILITSCKKDDPIPDGEATLQHDGENATGPLLAAGYHELAVYFPSGTMSQYKDWKLTEVTWFMGGFPDSCVVKIYDEGSGNDPWSIIIRKRCHRNYTGKSMAGTSFANTFDSFRSWCLDHVLLYAMIKKNNLLVATLAQTKPMATGFIRTLIHNG